MRFIKGIVGNCQYGRVEAAPECFINNAELTLIVGSNYTQIRYINKMTMHTIITSLCSCTEIKIQVINYIFALFMVLLRFKRTQMLYVIFLSG